MADKIWLKRVLIPCWVIQLLLSLIYLGVSAVALWAVQSAENGGPLDNNNYGSAIALLNVGAAIALSFAALTIIFDITEIILAARHKLRPVANIVLQSIKSLIWTLYFIFSIAGAVQSRTGGLSVILSALIFLSCMAQLIYGGVIVHRHRKGTLYRGNYSLAEGGMNNGTPYAAVYDHTAPQTSSYTAYNPQGTAAYAPAPYAPYSSQTVGTSHTSLKPNGAANDYYHAGGSYEMHSSARN